MRAFVSYLLLGLLVFVSVYAQSTPRSSLPSSVSQTVSLSLTTSSATITTVSRAGTSVIPVTTVVPTVFNVTVTATPTSTPKPAPIVLETKLDPAFGVLGVLLILTGLPSAFWGHKNRWTSFFLIGFYTLSLVCLVLILKFGVLPAVNPPSKTLRGMFVLACTVAGVAGGAIAIFFWKGAKFFIGAWGGFAFALWIQCFHNGGLISPIGIRWIFYTICSSVGFVLCTIPKLHYYILLTSTAIVGSSVFMLGVDCFTTAGLKEFYLWNVGFQSLFPKFTDNGIAYPVSQTIQIELGLLGAVAFMGMAVQLRILSVLQRKLREIAEEQRKRDEEAELDAAERFAGVMKDREQWEKEHPTHNRKESGLSQIPLIGDEDPSTPWSEGRRNSGYTSNSHYRPPSGLSNYHPSPTHPDDLSRFASRPAQTPGALPVLDLGIDIKDDVPSTFIAEEKAQQMKKDTALANPETLKRKEELMAEIANIRQSIEILKAETSSSGASRHPSLASRRTLSHDTNSLFLPASHARPPRQPDPRLRVQSLGFSAMRQSYLGESISRPTSAPLRDLDWDSYVHDRKLLQPPAGVSAPIPTTPRLSIPPAVAEALDQRRQRESDVRHAGDFGRLPSPSMSSEDVRLSKSISHSKPGPTNVPVAILPPRRQIVSIAAPVPQRATTSRTRTFEELAERHREKMRDMQTPLTQAENEQAELLAAKTRWEKSKTVEKEVVNRHLAEKAAAFTKEVEKRRRSEDGLKGNRRSMTLHETGKGAHRHSRSLSADKLAAAAGRPSLANKRRSTMKVEDWQKYQQDVGAERSAASSRRESRMSKTIETGMVPFPGPARPRHTSGYRHQRISGASRDPPT